VNDSKRLLQLVEAAAAFLFVVTLPLLPMIDGEPL
jgi:hypothetical protein